MANRLLVLAALAGTPIGEAVANEAADTRILRRLLRERPATMHCGDGGTTLRFLLAWAAVQPGGQYLLTGSPRLLERPHGPLVEALHSLGARIDRSPQGFLVRGQELQGGAITLHAPRSSQYITALLLVAARFRQGLQLHWTGQRLSEPYVRMTIAICRLCGVNIREEGDAITVEPGPIKPAFPTVPRDWSAAAFWYELAALAPGTGVALSGLRFDGVQGDEAIASLLKESVATTVQAEGMELTGLPAPPGPFTADLQSTPDLFQPMAFLMAGLGREARFTGLYNLPLKETDRIQAVAEALRTLGCTVEHGNGAFRLSGAITNLSPPPFAPQGDHRMAMGLAPLALVCNAITIRHPEVVEKSYPGFWDDLGGAGFGVRRA